MRLDGPSRIGALVATVVSLSGCPNPNAYTVPRTLEPGDLQLLAAAEAYAFTDRVTASSGTGSSTSRTSGATPLFPTLGIRYGLLDGLDFGARIDNFETLAGDLKVRLLRGRFDIALDPGLQALVEVAQQTDANGNTSSRNTGLFYLHAPLLLGLNLSAAVTLIASPGVAYSISTGPFVSGNGGEQASALTEVLARLGLGADIRTSDALAIHPEVTCMKGLGSSESLLCVVGLGLNIGAQPNYDDLRPAQPAEQ